MFFDSPAAVSGNSGDPSSLVRRVIPDFFRGPKGHEETSKETRREGRGEAV